MLCLPDEEEPRLVLAVDLEQLPAAVQSRLSQMLCLPDEEEPRLVLAVDLEQLPAAVQSRLSKISSSVVICFQLKVCSLFFGSNMMGTLDIFRSLGLCAGILKQFMRAIGTERIGLWYRPARLHRLVELIPGIDSWAA
jgi:hypothetical protein